MPNIVLKRLTFLLGVRLMQESASCMTPVVLLTRQLKLIVVFYYKISPRFSCATYVYNITSFVKKEYIILFCFLILFKLVLIFESTY